MISIATKPNEESTAKITVSFTDESGASVTPSAATWSLLDGDGNVVNSRNAVSLTPAASISWAIYGADLAITNGDTKRVILIEATYDSDLGSDLPFKENIHFQIQDLTGL